MTQAGVLPGADHILDTGVDAVRGIAVTCSSSTSTPTAAAFSVTLACAARRSSFILGHAADR